VVNPLSTLCDLRDLSEAGVQMFSDLEEFCRPPGTSGHHKKSHDETFSQQADLEQVTKCFVLREELFVGQEEQINGRAASPLAAVLTEERRAWDCTPYLTPP